MTSDDGTGSSARFKSPSSVVLVGSNLYVADYDNHSIRKLALATGAVTTFAGSNGVSGSTNGTGAEARFKNPFGITSDGAFLYVTDSGNNTIRKIDIATAAVSTLAGTAGSTGFQDRTGSAARFKNPTGITTVDGTSLYVTDSGNNSIRRVIVESAVVTTLSTGTITSDNASFVFAAVSTARGSKAAKFKGPYGVATDGSNLYVANTGNSALLKMTMSSGIMAPMAVNNSNPGSSFVFSAMTATNWSGSAAQFKNPYGITTDGANLYLTDSGNNAIRKLVLATDQVSTLAGTSGTSGAADGTGAAARFNMPYGIATDDGANLYIADNKNNTIRKAVVSTGAVSTLAGKAP
jgi:sugar lactone lactonase YvrE